MLGTVLIEVVRELAPVVREWLMAVAQEDEEAAKRAYVRGVIAAKRIAWKKARR